MTSTRAQSGFQAQVGDNLLKFAHLEGEPEYLVDDVLVVEQRGATAIVVLGILGLAGCADDTGGLGDGGPPMVTYCTGYYHDLEEQGEVTYTDIPCARGPVCGAGVDYQVCLPDSDDTRGESGLFHAEGISDAMMANPNYPFCQVASDCLHDFEGSCLLQPGCGEPEGICCGFLCIAGEGARAKDRCMQTPGCNLSYCGCDGVTYEGLPTRPYQYPGPCE